MIFCKIGCSRFTCVVVISHIYFFEYSHVGLLGLGCDARDFGYAMRSMVSSCYYSDGLKSGKPSTSKMHLILFSTSIFCSIVRMNDCCRSALLSRRWNWSMSHTPSIFSRTTNSHRSSLLLIQTPRSLPLLILTAQVSEASCSIILIIKRFLFE